ncbi:MAG: hypothetical protein ACTTI3_06320 [Treponema sp.]
MRWEELEDALAVLQQVHYFVYRIIIRESGKSIHAGDQNLQYRGF